jgi:tagaturonate reductase
VAAAPTGCPRLGRALLRDGTFRARGGVDVPAPELLDRPERAVQFGTGALLRGFVDYFVDEANRQGRFNGRVVAIGSTGSGRDAAINEQDGLYTLNVQGIEGGRVVRSPRVVSSVSRAISAGDQWDEVLACARNPELALVFSNTTEVGIVLDPDDQPDASPPRSFPGKLTRFLYERGQAFDWSPDRGVVVIPCELIEANGDRLREIVLDLAARWELDPAFAAWVQGSVPFCNTLVDRIVTGTPRDAVAQTCERFGYEDAMFTECEPYRLFAIQGDDALRARLRFAEADRGIVVAPDIEPYRERKVRILNGAHTLMVPLALLAGFETVGEAIADPQVGDFARRALAEEIVPGLETAPDAPAFARDVLDRFANPFIAHALVDITLQSTMKVRVRVVPSIHRYAAMQGRAPALLSLGFAGWLLYMRGDVQAARRERGLPVPADEHEAVLRDAWRSVDARDRRQLGELVELVAGNTTLWQDDLRTIPGFTREVTAHLARIAHDGPHAALEALAGAAR